MMNDVKKDPLSKLLVTLVVVFVVGLVTIIPYSIIKNKKKSYPFEIVVGNLSTFYLSGIDLNITTSSLAPGQTITLIPTVSETILDENCADRQAIDDGKPNIAVNPPVKYESSDVSVASVSEDGVVTAHSDGTAIITARTVNGQTATCEVTVTTVQSVNRIHYISNGDAFTLTTPKKSYPGPSPANTIVLESRDYNGVYHYGLIDTGLDDNDQYTNDEVNKNKYHATAVLNYLRKIGATHLDFIVVTHVHYDHLSGILDIIDGIQTDKVYIKPYYSRDGSGNSGSVKNRTLYANLLSRYYGDSFTCNSSCLSSRSNYINAIKSIDSLYGTTSYNVGTNTTSSVLVKINANSKWDSDGTLYLGNAVIKPYNTKNLGYYSSCEGLDENSNSIVLYIKMGTRKILIAGDLEPISKTCYDNVYKSDGDPSCSSSSDECSIMKSIVKKIDKSNTLNVDLLELSHHGYSSCDMSSSIKAKINPSHLVIPNWSEKIHYYYDKNGYYYNANNPKYSCYDSYFTDISNVTYVGTNNTVFDFSDNGFTVYTNND